MNDASPGRQLWRNRDFNIYWCGQTLSVLGDAFASLAMPLLVLQCTGSVAQMGAVTGRLPGRAHRGRPVRGIGGGSPEPAPADAGVQRGSGRHVCPHPAGLGPVGPRVWLIYVVMAVGSFLGNLSMIAGITLMVELVGKGELAKANRRQEAAAAVAFMVGPAMAGIVAMWYGAVPSIAFDAASFLCIVAALAVIRPRYATERPAGATAAKPFEGLVAGLRFCWHNPMLRWVAIIFGVFDLVSAPFNTLLIYHLGAPRCCRGFRRARSGW